ncbi:unnamed protein product [Diamesa hyperborea]
MKVDKAVSTTNDAYFANNNNTVATANNLNSIIKFETVFTTLVENKILAIKRECEQHEAAKKSRTIKSLLLRKPELTAAVTAAVGASDVIGHNEKNVNGKQSNKSNFFLKHKNKKQNDIDVEKGEQQASQPQQQSLQQLNIDIEVVKIEVQNDNEVVNCNTDQGLHLSNDNEHTSKLDRSQINEPLVLSSSPSIPTPSNEQLTTNNNCDKLIINSDNAQLPLSTSKVNNSSVVCSSNKEPSPSPHFDNDESLATTIDISLQQQSSVVVPNKSQMSNKLIHNDKSDVAIYDDGPSSQNTSDIEFSLVSETSVSELPFSNRKKLAAISTTVLSDPIMRKTGNLLSPLLQRGLTISSPGSKPDECKKYLPKQRSISEQSTPIFARHQQLKNEAEGKKYITFQKELPKKVVCDVKPIEKGKSQTVVIAPTVSTTTTALAKPISTITVAGTSGQETLLNANKKSQKHLNKFRDIAIEYEISYDDGNQSPRGFISSFNQLTSNIPPTAVITTNSKKQSIKQSKTQSMKDGRNQHEFSMNRGKSFDDKAIRGHGLEVELDDLAIDIDNKKRKRKRQNSRCSEPILVYPLASGLKHCILSRSPNAPIEYDPGVMYDVSLQIESEFNGELKSIVPPEHKKRKHKHHHQHNQNCKRNRHKNRKILVHNLDDKSVKVIDPDDLPQRARWTIIATACLLLIMCLLLVGITLRMAPLIDDMGK